MPSSPDSHNSIYTFFSGRAAGCLKMVDILGGKGAVLAEMCNLGLSVPPGFTISSEMCLGYYKNGQQLPVGWIEAIKPAIAGMEKFLGRTFGHGPKPLLVSVRSGAKISMPGMMDTILNLGLNDETVVALAAAHNNERFAFDSYRRFIQMYASVVLGVKAHHFEALLTACKQARGIELDSDLSADDLKQLINQFKSLVKQETGQDFPQGVYVQLESAIKAVFDSWMSARAITYRKIHHIPETFGTAVNVQAMVFGNFGNCSATGVLFTRNPSNGERAPYGEYLLNAQGEDVVAGIRTPAPLSRTTSSKTCPSLEACMPAVYAELITVANKLELHYKDMQDIEFTIEQGRLWILQARAGKRTFEAEIKILADMVNEGLIDKAEALKRIDPSSLNRLLHPRVAPDAKKTVITRGMPASPGAASGTIVFSADEAEKCAAAGQKVILVCHETSPEDIHGMHAAQGILTSCGGMTSHAAVVARGMGKVCIVGAKSLSIDGDQKLIRIDHSDVVLTEHDSITLDGHLGEVLAGSVATIQPTPPDALMQIMRWADEARELTVRANAETVEDIEAALRFGADGVGLCRTEHMFFEPNRIIAVRKMIIADSLDSRIAALNELLPMQRGDFVKILRLLRGKPINIRLLDMPLHEFIPKIEHEIEQLAAAGNTSVEFVHDRCNQLHECNPMLGHRGCRLAITYPEIYEMQVRAIFEAMAEISRSKSAGAANAGQTKSDFKQSEAASGRAAQRTTMYVSSTDPRRQRSQCLKCDEYDVEIMVPLISNEAEMKFLRALIENIANRVQQETGTTLRYKIGTMIELPRAALCADKIAPQVDFISYGTNDLSQTTFGLSRDDAVSFLPHYISCGILSKDPFIELDEEGVGELIRISLAKAKSTNPNIKAGICGEHGGDPKSINFFHRVGLDYVSCSPYRIQIAKLAAAQAALDEVGVKAEAEALLIDIAKLKQQDRTEVAVV